MLKIKINKFVSPILGLQMHVTDVYLEELAKVGGEDLEEGVLDIYLEPFFKVRPYSGQSHH